MDQRRADAVMDLFRRVADGNELPWMGPRRDREVGIVVHADTLFGDGPPTTPPVSCAVWAPPPPSTPSQQPSWPAARSPPAPPPG